MATAPIVIVAGALVAAIGYAIRYRDRTEPTAGDIGGSADEADPVRLVRGHVLLVGVTLVGLGGLQLLTDLPAAAWGLFAVGVVVSTAFVVYETRQRRGPSSSSG